jgi:aminopeptidase N
MRNWVTTRRNGNASTADFIRTACAVSGRDVSGLLTAWGYGATTPPLDVR